MFCGCVELLRSGRSPLMVECDNVAGCALGMHNKQCVVVTGDDSDEVIGVNIVSLTKGLDKALVIDHSCHSFGDFANSHGIMEFYHYQAVHERHNFESSVSVLGVHSVSPFKFNIYLNQTSSV